MGEPHVGEPDSGKPGPGDRGTEPPSADSKRFKQEGKSGPQPASGATGKSRIPLISSGAANRSSLTPSGASGTPRKSSPKSKKKDVCCLKSSSTSFQSLQDHNGQSPTASSGSPTAPTARSPRSSIFSRLLHRQGHGNSGADGESPKNSKSGKTDSGKTPKSPKSRLSDGRLKLFNRTSSLKEVKIAIPTAAKPASAKSSGQHGGQRASGLRQPTAREKASSKTKDASKGRGQPTSGHSAKSGSDRSTEGGAAGETPPGEGNPSGNPSGNGRSKGTGKKGDAQRGNEEAMETSSSAKEVPKCRRESVQAWVNSISDERLDGVEDMDQGAVGGVCVITMETAPPDESGAGDGVKADEDELTLGAEAKLLTPPKDVVLSRSTKHRLAEVGAASGRNRQTAWREMFSQIRTESFNSEGSAHSVRTWDSIDQLLSERTGDPEEILTNLGFHSQESDESLPSRIPERFLRQQSVANGISVSKFIDSNPDLKEYVALTRSTSEPSTASLASGDPTQETFSRKSSSGLSMASVVKTLTFIRKLTANMSWKEIDMTRKMLKPVDSATARLQNATISATKPSGQSFTSILHPDNCDALAEQGVYEDLAARARRESILSNGGGEGHKPFGAQTSPTSERRKSSVLLPDSPRLSVTNIPERFSPISMLVLPTEGSEKDCEANSPRSGNTSPRSSLNRIPQRFSPSVEEQNVSLPQLVIPSPSPEPTPDPSKVGDGLNQPEVEKKHSLNLPNEEPRRKSVSLWKRLSDAGREMEQRKSIAALLSKPQNFIDVSRSGDFPDIPVRFFLHSNGSILNPSLQSQEETEAPDEMRAAEAKIETKLQTEEKKVDNENKKKVDDENKNNVERPAEESNPTAHSESVQEISVDQNSNNVARKQSIKVMLRMPTEERDSFSDPAAGEHSDEILIDQPIRIQKRRLNSEGSIDRSSDAENSDALGYTDGRPSRKIRRKLGSMCKPSDQAILLKSLDKSSRTNSLDETENEQQMVSPMDIECEVLITDSVTPQPSHSVESYFEDIRRPKISVASDGLADDELEQPAPLSRREKASKYLRKYLSQAEEDIAAESDSDGSVADLNDNVEIGTAVLVANEASQVVHVERENGVDQGEMIGQALRIKSDPESESQEEGMTTDQGSISGDDVEDIYSRIKDFEVEINDVIIDASSIGGSNPVNSLFCTALDVHGATEPDQFVGVMSEDQEKDLDKIPFDTSFQSKRRQTICTVPLEVEKLKKAEARTFDYGIHGRWSDVTFPYDTVEKRRRFSRQEHVKPSDVPDSDTQTGEMKTCDSDLKKDIENGNGHSSVYKVNSIASRPDGDNAHSDVFAGFLTRDGEISENSAEISHEGNTSEDNPSQISMLPEHQKDTSEPVNGMEDSCFLGEYEEKQTPSVFSDGSRIIEDASTSPCLKQKSEPSELLLSEKADTAGLDANTEEFSAAESLMDVIDKENGEHNNSIMLGDFNSAITPHISQVGIVESELKSESEAKLACAIVETSNMTMDVSKEDSSMNSKDNLNLDISCHDKEREDTETDKFLPKSQQNSSLVQSVEAKDKFDSGTDNRKTNDCLEVPFGDFHDSTSVSDEGYISPTQPHVDNILPQCSMAIQDTLVLRIDASPEGLTPTTDQEESNEMKETIYVMNDDNVSAAIAAIAGEGKSQNRVPSIDVVVDEPYLSEDMSGVSIENVEIECSNEISTTEAAREITRGHVGVDVSKETNDTLEEQSNQILILSLCDEKTSTSEGDHSTSDGYEDMLHIVNQPRKLSLVRYTESERDESICSDSEDQECIYHEHIIDDNVLDRSLSEHSYLRDLLDQLKQNQQSLERPRRRSSDGSLSRRFSAVSQSHDLEHSWGDLLADSPLVERHRKMSALVIQKESADEASHDERDSSVPKPNTGTVSHQSQDDEVNDIGETRAILNQHSYDLEEVSSEDNFTDTLPKLNQEKKLTKGLSQRALSRAFSGQSDSSGFVDAEMGEIDWTQLKVSGLGSSADSESSSRRSSRDTLHPAVSRLKKVSHKDKPRASVTMGAAMDSLGKFPQEGKEMPKSDDDESQWDIIENGHSVSHKDFLFGVPQKMKGKPEEITRARPKRRSRKQRPTQAQWVSRLYIDPPTSPKVTPTNKMEVKVMIDHGKVTHIENARVVPVERSSMAVSGRGQRTVSFLHLCVANTDSELQIRPVDKGDFILPSLEDYGSSVDVSQHQVLCSLLRRSSTAWAPDNLSLFPLDQPDNETARQYSLWNSSDSAERKQRHVHLLEEVKLIQHAITKFKVEFRVLDLRSQSIYNQDATALTPEQRTELVELGNLRSQILQEINELERLLGERMRTILRTESSMYAGDLTSLNTVHQVVEVLKEQVYHTSLINGMSLNRLTAPPDDTSGDNQPPLTDSEGSGEPGSRESQLVKQLSELQDHLEENQAKTTTQLTATLEQMKQSLLAEVRERVRGETEQLRKQVTDSEKEVRDLKEQLQVYTHAPTGIVKPDSQKAEVRFPVNGSPPDQNSQVLMETVTKRVSMGRTEVRTVRDGKMEVHVTRSSRTETLPLESGFRPISKQGSEEEAHL